MYRLVMSSRLISDSQKAAFLRRLSDIPADSFGDEVYALLIDLLIVGARNISSGEKKSKILRMICSFEQRIKKTLESVSSDQEAQADNDENRRAILDLTHDLKFYFTTVIAPSFSQYLEKVRGVSWNVFKVAAPILVTSLFIFWQLQFLGFFRSRKNENKTDEDEKGKQKITFEDVIGLEDAKRQLMVIVKLRKKPDECKKFNVDIPKAALLVGPPGTGKTMLAKAFANECGLKFYDKSGAEFRKKYVGEGRLKLYRLFNKAVNSTSKCNKI
jgi:ATP-dependent Zn protease